MTGTKCSMTYPYLLRAERRFLCLVGDLPPRTDAEAAPIESIEIYRRGAGAALKRMLSCTGRMQGGLLYGTRDEGALVVGFATPAGVRPWLQGENPLEIDASYALGWTDCLRDAYSITPGDQPVEWIGNWIAYPDSRLHSPHEDLPWITAGATQGLCDEEHPLLFVGWEESTLGMAAYLFDHAARSPVAVDVAWQVP